MDIEATEKEKPKIILQDYGLISYSEAFCAQQKLQATLIEDKKNGKKTHSYLILCEHYPVFTYSKKTKSENIQWNQAQRQQQGIELVLTNRGGDVTYHGKGQIIAYFIADLEQFQADLHWYLRSLEEIIIFALSEYHVSAYTLPGLTGVWVNQKGTDAKIAAIGIHVKNWVTLHGISLNVHPDLDHFQGIIPCGIVEKPVTSLEQLTQRKYSLTEVKALLARHWIHYFEKHRKV